MTNSKHHEILLQGITTWNRWRRERPTEVPDLDDLRLTLCAKQLSGGGAAINLANARLRRADFRFASLVGADLSGADLSEADFSMSRLCAANLEGATLHKALFADTDLAEASLLNADICGADLSSTRHLRADQLKYVKGDAATRLPAGVNRPVEWAAAVPPLNRAGGMGWPRLFLTVGTLTAIGAYLVLPHSLPARIRSAAVEAPASTALPVPPSPLSSPNPAAAVIAPHAFIEQLRWKQDTSIQSLRLVKANVLPNLEPTLASLQPVTTTIHAVESALQPAGPVTAVDKGYDALLAYWKTPQRNDRWIAEFIEKHYLSGAAVDADSIRVIYTRTVAYFGSQTPLEEVSRQKAAYYKRWPDRSYKLIPGSVVITWVSADRAKAVFLYNYRVTSRRSLRAAGRGRAVLEIVFSGSAAHIASEGGELLASPKNATAGQMTRRG